MKNNISERTKGIRITSLILIMCVMVFAVVFVLNKYGKKDETKDVAGKDTAMEESVTGNNSTTENPTDVPATSPIENTTDVPAVSPTDNFEYTTQENNIPVDWLNRVKSAADYEIGAYMYCDIDFDNSKELFAAYLDMPLGEWKILRLKEGFETAEEIYSIQLPMALMGCSFDIINLQDEVQLVVNLSSDMTPDSMGCVFKMEADELKKLLEVNCMVYQLNTGEICIQKAFYGSSLDKATLAMTGRVWADSYIEYDRDTGIYREYAANEITEEEFNSYDNASSVLEEINNIFQGMTVKYTFYKRNNGRMHIQCEYEDDKYVNYKYCTLYYADNRITGKIQLEDGFISSNYTTLDKI